MGSFPNAFLSWLFLAAPLPSIGDRLWVALHTAEPTADQIENECSYGGYVRVSVVRSAEGWQLVENAVSVNQDVIFARCLAGREKVTHFSLGTAGSGHSQVLRCGYLALPIEVTVNVSPRFDRGSIQIIEA